MPPADITAFLKAVRCPRAAFLSAWPRGARIIAAVKQLVLDLIPAPAPTLANFVIGSNVEAIGALNAMLQSPAVAPPAKVLYLWGASGSGKSHLVRACGLPAARLQQDDEPAPASQSDTGVAVDDAASLDEAAQHAVFNLINLQQLSTGLLVATGSVAPRDLPIRRDLASRLGSGLVFQLQPLSDGEKADALRAHAQTRGFGLRDDVVAYLLRHSRRDMASLVGMLDALDKYSLETGREITLPLLRELSQPLLV